LANNLGDEVNPLVPGLGDVPDEHHLDDGSDSEVEDAREAFSADNVDDDKAEHDEATVKASVELAFSDVEQRLGLAIPQSDRQHARQIIPKVDRLSSTEIHHLIFSDTGCRLSKTRTQIRIHAAQI
jgi:hypothetical protein